MTEASRHARDPLTGNSRTWRLLAVLLVGGGGCFGYGAAVQFGLIGAGWGIIGVFQYVLLQLGALWLSLGLLLSAWLLTREGPVSASRRRIALVGLVAAALAVGVTVAVYRARQDAFALPQHLGWTASGLVLLGLQLPLGTTRSRRLRRGIFLAELLAVLVFIFGFLAAGGGYINYESYGFLSVGASTLLLLFGGPLYLLGARLAGRPREEIRTVF